MFSNRYIYSEKQTAGIITLGNYLAFWAIIYVIVTVYLIFFKHEVNFKLFLGRSYT